MLCNCRVYEASRPWYAFIRLAVATLSLFLQLARCRQQLVLHAVTPSEVTLHMRSNPFLHLHTSSTHRTDFTDFSLIVYVTYLLTYLLTYWPVFLYTAETRSMTQCLRNSWSPWSQSGRWKGKRTMEERICGKML